MNCIDTEAGLIIMLLGVIVVVLGVAAWIWEERCSSWKLAAEIERREKDSWREMYRQLSQECGRSIPPRSC